MKFKYLILINLLYIRLIVLSSCSNSSVTYNATKNGTINLLNKLNYDISLKNKLIDDIKCSNIEDGINFSKKYFEEKLKQKNGLEIIPYNLKADLISNAIEQNIDRLKYDELEIKVYQKTIMSDKLLSKVSRFDCLDSLKHLDIDDKKKKILQKQIMDFPSSDLFFWEFYKAYYNNNNPCLEILKQKIITKNIISFNKKNDQITLPYYQYMLISGYLRKSDMDYESIVDILLLYKLIENYNILKEALDKPFKSSFIPKNISIIKIFFIK